MPPSDAAVIEYRDRLMAGTGAAQRTRVAVVYYSATGNVHALAEAVGGGAEAAGAEVRLRQVEELASELLISQNQDWGRHRSIVDEAPVATLADLEWADGIAFGTLTRFGNVSAQLKQFLDQAGRLWQDGKLADRTSRVTASRRTWRLTSRVVAGALPKLARPSRAERAG